MSVLRIKRTYRGPTAWSDIDNDLDPDEEDVA